MALKWRGKKVTKRVLDAVEKGINGTMDNCVIEAKNNHPFRNISGTLEGSIQVVERAHREGDAIVGRWGSLDVVYALRIEFGFQGKDKRGAVINQRARPFLRPAANKIYPMLPDLIRAHYSAGV